MLRDGVEPVRRHGQQPEDRAHLDNGAPAPGASSSSSSDGGEGEGFLRFHDAQHGALAEPEPAQVDAEDAVEVLRQALRGGGEGGGDGGVVDEVVDAAEAVEGALDGAVDVGFQSLVHDKGEEVDGGGGGGGGGGGLFLEGGGGGGEAGGGYVQADDARAAVEGELENAGAADGAAGAGYEGDAAMEEGD